MDQTSKGRLLVLDDSKVDFLSPPYPVDSDPDLLAHRVEEFDHLRTGVQSLCRGDPVYLIRNKLYKNRGDPVRVLGKMGEDCPCHYLAFLESGK